MASIGNSPTTQAFTPAVDYFSGTGSATAFTLSRPVASVAQVQVTIDNVAQNPSSAYTVSSNTITFTSAPLSGTNNIYVYYTSPITQVIAPGQGTVTATSMASSTGTGAGVFQTSPTITTPTISGDATISGLTVGKGGGSVSNNTVVGNGAQAATATGDYNTAIGASSLAANTSGTQNTGIGRATLFTNTSGGYNFAGGLNSMYYNQSGASNTAVGVESMQANTTGGLNVAIGRQALISNTTASSNTAVGYQAGYASTGATGTFIGYLAGSTLATGTSGTYVGGNATASSTSVDRELVICTGGGGTGKGSSTGFINPNSGGVYQGNNSSSWSTTSDFRLKKNIVDNTEGLDKITAIRVRNFEYRTAEEVTELPAHTVIDKQGVQLGVIAQELREVCPDCVKEETTGVLSVDPDNLTWYMVNAIKDLKAINDTQAETINALTARIEALEGK